MFGKLKLILDALMMLATVDITTMDGLKKVFDILIEAGEAMGVPETILDKIREAMADEDEMNIVLAVVRWAHGHVLINDVEDIDSDTHVVMMPNGDEVSLEMGSISDWLPIITQIITIIQSLRRPKMQALIGQTEFDN